MSLLHKSRITQGTFKHFEPLRRTFVDLAYKAYGMEPPDGTPVLVLHGLMGSKRNWGTVSKAINDQTLKTVFAVDLRNHGESPHAPEHSYLDLAADVVQLMKRLSIPKASFVGHSMGGKTSMVVALQEPSLVSSLVVVDISPVSSPGNISEFFPELIKSMKNVNFKGIKNVAEARKEAVSNMLKSGIVQNEHQLGFITMHIGERDKKFGWMYNLETLERNISNIATFPGGMDGKQYNGPTLFVGGGQSDYLPPGDLQGIRKMFPKAELTYVKDVGHNVHAEDPAGFLEIVVPFIKNN